MDRTRLAAESSMCLKRAIKPFKGGCSETPQGCIIVRVTVTPLAQPWLPFHRPSSRKGVSRSSGGLVPHANSEFPLRSATVDPSALVGGKNQHARGDGGLPSGGRRNAPGMRPVARSAIRGVRPLPVMPRRSRTPLGRVLLAYTPIHFPSHYS
jgi:hypothetical protein